MAYLRTYTYKGGGACFFFFLLLIQFKKTIKCSTVATIGSYVSDYLTGGTMQKENIHIWDYLAWYGYDLVVSALTLWL